MAGRVKFLNLCTLPAKRKIEQFHRHVSTDEKPCKREYQDVQMKVPWGKLAGKLWGPPEGQPILALHGLQDNIGTFEPLMRDFPRDLTVLAMDMPGHGLSSWLPRGIMYTPIVYAAAIHRIKEHFNLKKFGIIGHSFGAMTAFYYQAHFPEAVKFFVSFDWYKYPTENGDTYVPQWMTGWRQHFALEVAAAPNPRYSESAAVERYRRALAGSASEEMCRILFARGVKRHEDGTVSYTRDPRVQCQLTDSGFTGEQHRAYARRTRCPFFVIKADGSHYYDSEQEYFEVLKIIEKNSPEFHFHRLPGTHHFLMADTKRIVELVAPFVRKYA